jgi:hypothetical protein
MMMVMTMMEVDLHLRNNPKEAGFVCQIVHCKFSISSLVFPNRKAQNCEMRSRFEIALCVVLLASPPTVGVANSQKPAQPVDINRASLQELEKVPGITPTWAARIIRFRPYRTKLDLLDQGVLTPEVYQRIRERVIAHRTSPQSAEQH